MANWIKHKFWDKGTVITGKIPSSKNPEHWGNLISLVDAISILKGQSEVYQIRGLKNSMIIPVIETLSSGNGLTHLIHVLYNAAMASIIFIDARRSWLYYPWFRENLLTSMLCFFMACFSLALGNGGFSRASKKTFRSLSAASQFLCFSIMDSAFSATALMMKSVSDRYPPISSASWNKSFCLRGIRKSSRESLPVAISEGFLMRSTEICWSTKRKNFSLQGISGQDVCRTLFFRHGS